MITGGAGSSDLTITEGSLGIDQRGKIEIRFPVATMATIVVVDSYRLMVRGTAPWGARKVWCSKTVTRCGAVVGVVAAVEVVRGERRLGGERVVLPTTPTSWSSNSV